MQRTYKFSCQIERAVFQFIKKQNAWISNDELKLVLIFVYFLSFFIFLFLSRLSLFVFSLSFIPLLFFSSSPSTSLFLSFSFPLTTFYTLSLLTLSVLIVFFWLLKLKINWFGWEITLDKIGLLGIARHFYFK